MKQLKEDSLHQTQLTQLLQLKQVITTQNILELSVVQVLLVVLL